MRFDPDEDDMNRINLEVSNKPHSDVEYDRLVYDELSEAFKGIHSASQKEDDKDGFEKAFETAYGIINDNDSNPNMIKECVQKMDLIIDIRESFETFHFVQFMKLFSAISKIREVAETIPSEFISELADFTLSSITDQETIETICASLREIVSFVKVNPEDIIIFALNTISAYVGYTPIEASCLEILSKLIRAEFSPELLNGCFECACSYIKVETISLTEKSLLANNSYNILRGCFESNNGFCIRIFEECFDDVFDPSFSPYAPQLYTLASWFIYVENKDIAMTAIKRLQWQNLMSPIFGSAEIPGAIAELHKAVGRVLPQELQIFEECGAWDTVVTIANQDSDFASRCAAVDAIAGSWSQIPRIQIERFLRCNFALPVCEVLASEPTNERLRLLIEIMRTMENNMKKKEVSQLNDIIEEEGVEKAIDDDDNELDSSIIDQFIEELRILREYISK